MELSFNQDDIIDKFPNIELSYDFVHHKKVPSEHKHFPHDMCIAIPQGRKCFAWFTYIRAKTVCIILHLKDKRERMRDNVSRNKKNHFNKVEVVPCVFDKSLSIGTIVYGTFINHKTNRFFFIENIFTYKGKNIERMQMYSKFDIISKVMERDMQQRVFTKHDVCFGLPCLTNTYSELRELLPSLPYTLFCIQYISFSGNKNPLNVPIESLKFSVHYDNAPVMKFKIMPDLQPDIYHLYVYHNGNTNHYHSVALIPDYTTSVQLNSLFRNIKENKNLDALELSDSEDEFENIEPDKFVNLDKCLTMECSYNYRFKRWVPRNVVRNARLSTLREIQTVQ